MCPVSSTLLVVDVQLGFLDPSWGPRNNPGAEANIALLISAWRKAGKRIHHVHHSSRSPTGKFFRDAPGHHVKPEAAPVLGEPIHVKEVNSAFIGTNLERDLRAEDCDALVIVGLTTNHCISTTARMASNLGFATYVVEDATATFDRKDLAGRTRPAIEVHAAALSDLSEEFATIISTHDAIEAIGGGMRPQPR